jgi:hypothetical protein
MDWGRRRGGLWRGKIKSCKQVLAILYYPKMRDTFLILFISLSFNNSFGQTALDTDGLNNINNVYLFSLKEYCKSLDTTKSKIVHVRADYFIGDSWPEEIICFHIKYLQTDSDYISPIKQNKGNIIIVGITPFDFRNGEFSCGIIPFSATYKKNNIRLSNSGGLTVYFTYDSKLKGLIYKSKKWTRYIKSAYNNGNENKYTDDKINQMVFELMD